MTWGNAEDWGARSGKGDDDIRPKIGIGEDGISRCALVRLRAAEHCERGCTRAARVEPLQNDAAICKLQVVAAPPQPLVIAADFRITVHSRYAVPALSPLAGSTNSACPAS